MQGSANSLQIIRLGGSEKKVAFFRLMVLPQALSFDVLVPVSFNAYIGDDDDGDCTQSSGMEDYDVDFKLCGLKEKMDSQIATSTCIDDDDLAMLPLNPSRCWKAGEKLEFVGDPHGGGDSEVVGVTQRFAKKTKRRRVRRLLPQLHGSSANRWS